MQAKVNLYELCCYTSDLGLPLLILWNSNFLLKSKGNCKAAATRPDTCDRAATKADHICKPATSRITYYRFKKVEPPLSKEL